MSDLILTLNAGSSSMKFALFEVSGTALELAAEGQVEGIGSRPHFVVRDGTGADLAESYWEPVAAGNGHTVAFRQIWSWLDYAMSGKRLVAVGHRIAHGGERFVAPVLVDDDVLHELDRLIPLVPLHQPHNLAGIRGVSRLRPDLPQAACFDTAFHRHRPAVSQRVALPEALVGEGVRRYGFHGISYEYIVKRLAELDREVHDGRVIIAHLGSGCSMCATLGGVSVETTMSFSALDGLPMGTRCGSLDPGLILYLLREKRMDVDRLERLLYRESGLLGMSGVSNDMRVLHESEDPRAREAIDYFVYHIGQHIGALASTLGGLDALVFTAGIGEHDAELRLRVCRDASWLGLTIDVAANDSAEARISPAGSKPSVWVVPTDEERMIATHTLKLVAGM